MTQISGLVAENQSGRIHEARHCPWTIVHKFNGRSDCMVKLHYDIHYIIINVINVIKNCELYNESMARLYRFTPLLGV